MEAELKPTDGTSQEHDSLLQQHSSTSCSDEDPIGVGAGKKGQKKCSASSSKTSTSASTKKLTKSDIELWPEDLPDTYTKCTKSCKDILRAAMHQGLLEICWAIAFARNMEALLARRNIIIQLSPQHLVNNIRNKDATTGRITKYNEIKKILDRAWLGPREKLPPSQEKSTKSVPKVVKNRPIQHPFYFE